MQRLSDSGVWTAEELLAFQAKIPPGTLNLDSDWLAAELVQRKKLTQYQADSLREEDPTPLVLGNYILEEKIGAGGMGVVYRARHRRMKRVVAVKVLSQNSIESASMVKRFLREAEAAAQLVHPNIVAAYDADEIDHRPFLVMEYVDGMDLAEYVKRHGPMDFETAIDCINQAAKGLEHAHQQGIIHRDMKPANILLDVHGTAKILDLGLARFQDGSATVSTAEMAAMVSATMITQTGSLLGTVDFMSPEQAIDSSQADFASDIYSLGATFYFLVTGKAMYEQDNLMDRLMAHRSGPLPSLCEFSQLIPPQIDWIFHKMVAKTKEQRYKSMSIVIRDLTHWKKLKKSKRPKAVEADPAQVPETPPRPKLRNLKPNDSLIDVIFDDDANDPV